MPLALLPSTSPIPQVSHTSPSASDPTIHIKNSPPLKQPSLEGHTMSIPDCHVDRSSTALRGLQSQQPQLSATTHLQTWRLTSSCLTPMTQTWCRVLRRRYSSSTSSENEPEVEDWNGHQPNSLAHGQFLLLLLTRGEQPQGTQDHEGHGDSGLTPL